MIVLDAIPDAVELPIFMNRDYLFHHKVVFWTKWLQTVCMVALVYLDLKFKHNNQ